MEKTTRATQEALNLQKCTDKIYRKLTRRKVKDYEKPFWIEHSIFTEDYFIAKLLFPADKELGSTNIEVDGAPMGSIKYELYGKIYEIKFSLRAIDQEGGKDE